MKSLLEQRHIETMHGVVDAIAVAISKAKHAHSPNDTELSRYLAAALVNALIEETANDRTVEILASHGSY